jgi:hypothetical protein
VLRVADEGPWGYTRRWMRFVFWYVHVVQVARGWLLRLEEVEEQ